MANDAVDGALAELGGQGEDFGGEPAQVAVLLFQAVQLLAASSSHPRQTPLVLHAKSSPALTPSLLRAR